jgi:hypothetical protein
MTWLSDVSSTQALRTHFDDVAITRANYDDVAVDDVFAYWTDDVAG